MSSHSERSRVLGLALVGVFSISAAAIAGGSKTAIATREVKTLDGRLLTLQAPKDGATAVVFYSSECPISNAYSPTLNDLRRSSPRPS